MNLARKNVLNGNLLYFKARFCQLSQNWCCWQLQSSRLCDYSSPTMRDTVVTGQKSQPVLKITAWQTFHNISCGLVLVQLHICGLLKNSYTILATVFDGGIFSVNKSKDVNKHFRYYEERGWTAPQIRCSRSRWWNFIFYHKEPLLSMRWLQRC